MKQNLDDFLRYAWGDLGGIVEESTLLDYFAGQCLAGVSADPDSVWNDETAKFCYDMAERMLKEREKRNKPDADR